LAILERNVSARLGELLLGKVALSGPQGISANMKLTETVLDDLSRGLWW